MPRSPRGDSAPGHNAAVTDRPRPWKRLRTVRSEDYQILQVREDVFADPRTGEEHPRVIIDADEWANVVAFTPDDRVILVRQWRFGSRAEGLEVPGGVVDKGESPERAAARELEEETGYRPGSIEAVGWLWPNPAHFTNRQHTFVARGCEKVHDGMPDGSEDLVIELVPRAAVPDLIRKGEIRHALHVAALHLALVAERS
jgi:8-oxo-dGTP pyrophosphatase MutT (NUDIX family)